MAVWCRHSTATAVRIRWMGKTLENCSDHLHTHCPRLLLLGRGYFWRFRSMFSRFYRRMARRFLCEYVVARSYSKTPRIRIPCRGFTDRVDRGPVPDLCMVRRGLGLAPHLVSRVR